ncbi:probable disease resistance protein At5g66900 [Abrus precatorius]|uniref:Probable disease resistance protein At5g66900 n=1 Tax=Abrus precatorius TaxID=3816 RepID=A0A8B8KT22_ABRPR|nr:probable disease resistance protein At5g66900 [Abrus precatorius]
MGETTQCVALGTLFQDRLKMILEIVEKGQKSESNKQILRSTLKDMTPVVEEIKQYNEHLNPPREEINNLIKEKDAKEEFVCKSSSMNCCWEKCLSCLLYGFAHKRDDSFAIDDKQALMANDIKETLCKVREILELLSKENYQQKLSGVGAPMKCPFGVPENPEFTVGLDVPLSKLKMEVLNEGVSIIVLTGVGGMGKTTLATKLCWDEQVKGKFGENILFVTFSKTPKLRIIIQRLFEHCGYPVPDFQSDENAFNQLGLLLRQIGGSPMLLVLDDVWPGSETLVEKFKVQIPDYKVLVTSRVAFHRLGTHCILKPLVHEDAMTLFHHYALLEESSSSIPDEDLVQKVVRNCKGLPLAIKVIGRSLSHHPSELWQKMVEELSQGHSILDSDMELLTCLQRILDLLEDNPINIIKECFMDLALFPEDQRIPVTALIDMWAELYRLDDDGIDAMTIINKLNSMNLVNVLVARKNASDTDNYYYNNHFIILHDLLRELAIYQNNQEPMEQRKRLIIDINGNKREWWLGKKQKGVMAGIFPKWLEWCVKLKSPQAPAHILSISTDENCTPYLSHMQPAQTKVLILNLQTKQYSFPEFMEEMSKLKVLIITNYSFHPSEMNNFELLGSIRNLERIRLERISVPSFVTLKNLKKISLYLCNLRQALENVKMLISEAFPNLEELNIDYCKDMVELPKGLCDITPLKKLSITNCHKLSVLPQEIGKLENLELLRLSSCTGLEGIPDSIGRLPNLRLIDISNCINLRNLPENFGNLSNLQNLYMTSCTKCELPFSVASLENLKVVICDEETAASWEAFKPMLPNLKIDVPGVDVNLNWLHTISS